MGQHTASTTIISQSRAVNSAWMEHTSRTQGWVGADSSNYYSTSIKFQTPAFGNGSSTNISFRLWVSPGYNTGSNVSIRYAICTSDVNKSLYTSTYSSVTSANDAYQIVSGSMTLTDLATSGGSVTYKTISIDTSKLLPSQTYFLFLWPYNSKSTRRYAVIQAPSNYDEYITVTYYDPYTLTISAGSGSSIAVTRTSSGRGSIGELSNGAVLYHNDLLRISFSAGANHKLLTTTVNDVAFTSGNTHTVSSNVVVRSTAQPLASDVGATDANIESATAIVITRYNNAYTHTLTYSFEGLSGEIVSNTPDTTVSWVIPSDFYNQIPNSKSGKCTIVCETFDGSSSLGKRECSITVNALYERCAPIVSGIIEDINEITSSLTGGMSTIVRYLSTALCTISSIAQKGSTITDMKINGTTVSYESPSVTYLECENTEFVFEATDSRGYKTTTIVVPENVIPYVKLTINPVVRRPSPISGEISMSFNGRFYNGNIGVHKNTLTVRYRYRNTEEPAYGQWITVDSNDYSTGTSSYSSYGELTLRNNDDDITGFDYRKSYEFQVQAIDGASGIILSNVIMTVPVQKGVPVFDWGEKDFNFNVDVKIYEVNIFDIFYPVGSLFMSTVNTMPEPLASACTWNPLTVDSGGIYMWERIK